MKTMARWFSLLAAILFVAGGCTATRSFPVAARPGDMVILPVGWNKNLTRQNITVTITPSSGSPVTLGPNDPNIRAVVNLYPDPVSRLIVGTETNQDLGVGATTYGASIQQETTGQDKDWWETVVYVRLPATLPAGNAAIDVAVPQGLITAQPIQVEILPISGTTTGTDPFSSADIEQQLASLERADHYTVTFTGSAVPHSIQVELSYIAGIGKPWVINPRGDLKNLAWTNAGSFLKVMLTPANGQTPGHLSHFKFYVAGNITGLQVMNVRAYDIFGNLIPNISASVQ